MLSRSDKCDVLKIKPKRGFLGPKIIICFNLKLQENDWVYVISEDNHEGFIPHSYCAQYGSQLATLALNVKKKLPRGGGNPDMSLAPTSMSMSPTRYLSKSKKITKTLMCRS